VQQLMATIIESQLKKLELKMKHFEEMEESLERERQQVITYS